MCVVLYDMLINKLPAWSQPIFEKLAAHEPIPGLDPHPIKSYEKQQIDTTAWVIDTYMRYDEQPAHDSALGEPGRVLLKKSELHFETDKNGVLEASLLGQDKEGRPVALLFQKDDAGTESYSIQNLGEYLYVQGGRITADETGFYMAKGFKQLRDSL